MVPKVLANPIVLSDNINSYRLEVRSVADTRHLENLRSVVGTSSQDNLLPRMDEFRDSPLKNRNSRRTLVFIKLYLRHCCAEKDLEVGLLGDVVALKGPKRCA